VVGNVVGHAAGDTDGFEYIVKKSNGDLLSVTQKDPQPLGIGAHVLLIEGPQARIVPDYTVPVVVEALHPEDVKPTSAKTEPAPPATTAAAQPATLPPTVTPSSLLPTTAAVIASPLPPPLQPLVTPAAMPAPAPTSPQTAAANPSPAPEQKPATPPEAQMAPAPKPEDTPKPASGS